NKPRFIILEHAPEGHTDEAPIVLVGKGMTFEPKLMANLHKISTPLHRLSITQAIWNTNQALRIHFN
ncbi:MAG: hypothetical protein EOO68_18510, partial [Moraxellaceae bacterium]